MKVQFLGSGDAFGSGGRFNTCFFAQAAQSAFLIDCGVSSLIAMRRLGVDPNLIGTVFVSHLHGDHFGGLPFFILDAQFYSRRTAALSLVGPPGFRRRLVRAMEIYFPGSSKTKQAFSIDIHEMTPGEKFTINGIIVTPYLVRHECGAPPLALRFECEGKIIAYTGDTEWTDNLIAAGQNADLLIAEALSFQKKIKYHLDYFTLKTNLPRIGAKRVLLTHMGPEMLSHLADIAEEVATDGLILDT